MIIVCYDFSDDHKRTKFSKFLSRYGDRIQYSVFVIKNSKRVLQNVLTEIDLKYKKNFSKTDNIFIFRLCNRCVKNIKRYGNAGHYEEDIIYFD